MNKRIFRSITVIAGLGLLASICGCGLVGATIERTSGPGYIKAEYVPVATDDMLVLVENYNGMGQLNQDATYLNDALNKEVKDHKIATLVDEHALDNLKDAKPDQYKKMTVDAIGRAVGAKQVLYVNVTAASVDVPASKQTVRGHMEVRVRVIDCKTGATRWPDSDDGDLVKIDTPLIQHETDAIEMQVRHDMSDQMAVTIGNLFHNWQPKTEDSTDKVETSGMAD